MQNIQTLLQGLDCLYRSETMEEYEKTWVRVAQKVQDTFQGFTLAYAELYLVGIQREADGSMHHVLVPQEAM